MGIYQNQLQITEFDLQPTGQNGAYDLQPKDKYNAQRGSIAYVISPEDEIHHITNTAEHYALSIHVYGKELNSYRIFDLEAGQIQQVNHSPI